MVRRQRRKPRKDDSHSRCVTKSVKTAICVCLTKLGTGGVSMFALKLARAAGARVILSSSSDVKLAKIQEWYPSPPILTVNYNKNPDWDEEVMRLTNGTGVDFVLENGGAPSLVRSIKCARRGGI